MRIPSSDGGSQRTGFYPFLGPRYTEISGDHSVIPEKASPGSPPGILQRYCGR
jgi:hypothetical protein